MLNFLRPFARKREPISPALPASPALSPKAARARLALAACFARPLWSIRPEAEARLRQALAPESASFWFDLDDGDADDLNYTIRQDGVAVVPVVGVLLDCEPEWWMPYLGCTSIPGVGRMLVDAYADERAPKGVAIYCDSPGGMAAVSGLADIVWSLRQDDKKPVVTVAKEICSAAYHFGSQASRVIVAPDAAVGCIGTLIVSQDSSALYRDIGIEAERITSTGAETYKGAGSDGTPITDAQKADFKRICDEAQEPFTANVARGRGLTAQAAQTLADGRYHLGKNAVALKLADAVMGVEDAIALLASGDGWPDESPCDDDTDDDDTGDFNPPRDERGRFAPQIPPDPDQSRKKGNEPMTLWEQIQAALSGQSVPEATHTKPDAGSAGLSLADRAELDRLKAEEKARQTQEQAALVTRREQVKACAVAAFGNTPALASAVKVIDATASAELLDALEQTYKAAKPAAFQPRGRMTSPETLTDSEQSGNYESPTDIANRYATESAKQTATARLDRLERLERNGKAGTR